MRVDRSRDRPVRHLEWRVRLLGVGAVLGLAGMMMESEWMVNAAIGVLIITFVLRFVGRKDLHSEPEWAGEEADAASGDDSYAGEPRPDGGEGPPKP